MLRRLTAALAAWSTCPLCGWWAEQGHVCHPADR
jgi:hypothetical protein